jgi:purine-nucleoside phosphorylase
MLATDQALARHILQYDATDPATFGPHSLPRAVHRPLKPIPWPTGMEPKAHKLPYSMRDSALAMCQYAIVTWTVEEARALADVLTAGFPSKTAWYPYAHRWDEYKPLIRRGAPSLEADRLGSYFYTEIAGKTVLCFKSELHMSQDGPKLPVAKLFRQIIEETGCKLIITTGTAGGIGADEIVGDVVVPHSVRFDCKKMFAKQPWHDASYPCSKVNLDSIRSLEHAIKANADELPTADRPPHLYEGDSVVTTDFFGFDTSANSYGLHGLGAAVEMGDAVLGMVIAELGASAPKWTAIRNASDPQIDMRGLTLKEAATKAARIYEQYGYWSTVCSAIVCAAVVAAN